GSAAVAGADAAARAAVTGAAVDLDPDVAAAAAVALAEQVAAPAGARAHGQRDQRNQPNQGLQRGKARRPHGGRVYITVPSGKNGRSWNRSACKIPPPVS